MDETKTEENYYLRKTIKVEDLKHFPFASFTEFEKAVQDRKVLDLPIAMDMARSWLTNSSESPAFWRNSSYALMFLPYLIIIFYLIAIFWLSNWWLLLFVPLSIIVMFTGSPAARRMLPIHYILGIIFVLMWVIGGKFPDLVYWLPIFLIYLSLSQLYNGSAKIAREAVLHDEKTLCLFWKWNWMSVVLSTGKTYSQRNIEEHGQYTNYDDIDIEWKEYYERKLADKTKNDKKEKV